MASPEKPLLVVGCTPIYGHIMPIKAIAKQLIAHGYEVTFVSGSHYRKALEDIGCEYVAIEGYGDYYEAEFETRWPARFELPSGPLQMIYDLEHIFIRVAPSQHAAMQKAMRKVSEKHPGRPIVTICESAFQGGVPITLGAKGIKPTATMGIGVIPMPLSSIDTAPFGTGLFPDSSPEGRARNAAMAQEGMKLFGGVITAATEVMVEVGATPFPGNPLDASYHMVDRFVQLCIPAVEYPRSDAPQNIRFAGGVPKASHGSFTNPPSFWQEVVDNKEKKDIIFVCQGTVALNYADLILPTMEALKDRPNTILVVALGQKGASLPESTIVPENTRVADFIPFDDLLPHCAAFITNGGYGGFQHAISNGTPIVTAGAGEDKEEVSARAAWSGMGINLKTKVPTTEAIRAAVDEIVANPKYRTSAKKLEAERASYDPMSIIEKNIQEIVTEKQGK